MAITYRSVISQAINNFNSIQDSLSGLGATYDGATITLTNANGAILVPTTVLGSIISDQLQLKASGNIELTAQTGTDVTRYATASVRSAATFSLAVTDKTTAVTIGSKSGDVYPVTTSLTGKLTASTAGWFSSGSATDSSVKVGTIAAATLGVGLSGNPITIPVNPTFTLDPSEDSTSYNAVNISGSSSIGALQYSEADVQSLASGAWEYFIKVKSSVSGSGSTTVTGTASVTKAGYVTTTDTASGTGTISASVSGTDDVYIPVNKATQGATITWGGSYSTYTTPTNTGYAITATPKISTSAEGWMPTGDVNGTAATRYVIKGAHSASVKSVTPALSGTSILTTTKPSGTLNTDYWALQPTATAIATSTVGTAGWIVKESKDSSSVSGSGTEYYLPKATFKYVKESTSGATFIECKTAGYMPTGALTLVDDSDGDSVADIDYANVYATLSSSILTTTGASGDYQITLSKAETTNPGYITGTSGQGSVALDNTYYVKKGTAKAPTSISGTSATVSVSSGTITLTKSVSVTPSVTAGYITAGTATTSTVTLSGTIATTSLTAGAGSCAITNNSTSPTASGQAAKTSDSTSSPYNTYVTVSAKGSGTVSVASAGYIGAGSLSSNEASDTARIAAVVNPSKTAGTPSSTLTLNTASTYTEAGVVTKAYPISSGTSCTKTATISAVTVLNASTDYKDKYVIGTFTAKTNAGTSTVNIGADVTGAYVDEAVESLYQRMLGNAYTEIRAED